MPQISEKNKSKKQRFFENGILLTAVGIAMRTVSLFSGAFISRTVGAEGIGLFTLVMTVYGFGVTFATSGISLTVTRLVAEAIGQKKRERLPGILTGAILYAFLFSIVAALALLFGADLFALRFLSDARSAVCLRVLAPSLIPLSLLSVFSGYFVGIRRVRRNAAAQIIGQAIKILLTVLCLVRTDGSDVARSALLLSLVTTLTEFLNFFVILVQFLLERSGEKGARREKTCERSLVFRSAFPLGLSAYVRQALITAEHILIPRSLVRHGDSHSDALASYGILHGMALSVVLYPMATLTSFSGLLVPEFAESFAAEDRRRLSRLARVAMETTLFYAVTVAVFLLFYAEEIGYAVYRSSAAGMYISILAPVIPIMYLDHVTDSMLKGIGEQVYSMWVNVLDAAISVLLVVLLLPRFGIVGYAVVIIAMEAFNFFLSLSRLKKRISFSFSMFSSVVFPALVSCLAVGLTDLLFLREGSAVSLFWLVMRMIFSMCAAAVFFFLFRAVFRLYRGYKNERKKISRDC